MTTKAETISTFTHDPKADEFRPLVKRGNEQSRMLNQATTFRHNPEAPVFHPSGTTAEQQSESTQPPQFVAPHPALNPQATSFVPSVKPTTEADPTDNPSTLSPLAKPFTSASTVTAVPQPLTEATTASLKDNCTDVQSSAIVNALLPLEQPRSSSRARSSSIPPTFDATTASRQRSSSVPRSFVFTVTTPGLDEPEIETPPGARNSTLPIVDSRSHIEELPNEDSEQPEHGVNTQSEDGEEAAAVQHDPEALLQLPKPRPTSPTPDDWERETVMPDIEDEVSTTSWPSFERRPTNSIMADPAHIPGKMERQPCKPEFTRLECSSVHDLTLAPSERHLALEQQRRTEKQRLPSLVPGPIQMVEYHHLNSLGQVVPERSDMPAAVSVAILHTYPKMDMCPTAMEVNGAMKYAVLTNAFRFIDPVFYKGDYLVLWNMTAGAIRDEATGQCEQPYTDDSNAEWRFDPSFTSDDMPLYNDPNVETEHIILDGEQWDRGQVTQYDFWQNSEKALAAHEKDRRSKVEKRKDTFRVLLQEPDYQKNMICFARSPLCETWTPEDMELADENEAAELVLEEEQKRERLSTEQTQQVRPSTRTLADLDSDDESTYSEYDPDDHNEVQELEEYNPESSPLAGNGGLTSDNDLTLNMVNEEDPIYGFDSHADDHKPLRIIEDDESDEELYGITYKQEYELLHGEPMSETPSKEPSPKSSPEETSSDEEMSPIPSPEIRRIVSASMAAMSPTTPNQHADIITPSKHLGPSNEELAPYTPDSVKKIIAAPSSIGVIFSGGKTSSTVSENQKFSMFKDLPAPRQSSRIPRSPSMWNISEAYKGDATNRTMKDIKILSEITGENEDGYPASSPPPLELTEINRAFRESKGLPEPGHKSLEDDFGTENIATSHTPPAVKTYRQRKASLAQLSPITDQPTTPTVAAPPAAQTYDFSDIMMTPNPSSCTLPEFPRTVSVSSSVPDMPSSPPVIRPSFTPPGSPRLTPSSSPFAGSSILGPDNDYGHEPILDFWPDFSGDWTAHHTNVFSSPARPVLNNQPATPVRNTSRGRYLAADSPYLRGISEHVSRNPPRQPTRTERLTTWLGERRVSSRSTKANNNQRRPENEVPKKGLFKKIYNSLTFRR